MAVDAFHEEDYASRMDLGIWRKLLGWTRPYRWHLAGVVAMSAVTAACDSLMPLVTREVVDSIQARAKDPAAEVPMLKFALQYFCLMAAMAISVWGFIYLCGRIATGMSHDIRQAGFRRLQELSFSYYDRRPVGWLVARLTSDCDRLSRIIAWGCLDLLMGFWMVTLASVILVTINWKLSLVVLVIVPPLAVISIYFKRRLLEASRAVRKINSRITAGYNESITGVRTTKTLVREDENLGEFRQLTDDMYRSSVRNALLGAVYLPLVVAMGSVSAALALWAGGSQFLAGAISVGTLLLFMTYAGQYIWPIAEVARVFTDMQAAQAAAERVLDLLDTQPEILDSPEVAEAIADRRRQLEQGPPTDGPPADGLAEDGLAEDGYPAHIGDIEFRHVDFSYKTGKPVLQDFSLTVRAGQTVAFVGPTGGGKTTIVGLLCRFYEPTGGEILVNGVNYRRRSLHWLQSNLGIVLQAPHLFKGTIRENIRYGKLDADDQEIERVARLVNAHDFIMAAPGGYESDVGEGGNKLSTGQKQLISLARAVLADPQIFVMDEATSSVDTQTEQLIQAGVEKVLRGRTSFVIAHRLSTIRSADRIVVIDGGRIVEEGDHQHLIRRRGRYYELYTNQFTQEKEDEILKAAAGNG